MVRFNGKFKVTQVKWLTSPGPSTWMALLGLLRLGVVSESHSFQWIKQKPLWKALGMCAAHVDSGRHYSPDGEQSVPLKPSSLKTSRGVGVGETRRLSWGLSLVSCSDCMQHLENVSGLWPCTKMVPVAMYKFSLSYSIFRCKVNYLLLLQEG